MLGMPDAAMVNQMALKEQVPDNMMVLWLASKGLPVSFASLVGRYRELQKEAQNPMAGGQLPKTTVAEDVTNGLASLKQNLIPPMPDLTQLQGQPQPQPAPDQGQPQPQPQPSPDQGQMPPPDQGQQQGPPGLAGLNPGVLGQPGMAGGGIIAFTGGGQGAQEQDQQNQEQDLFNQLNPQEQQPTPAPQRSASLKAPTSLDQIFAQYGEGMDDVNAAFDTQINNLNQMEVYQAGKDPSIEQERQRLITEKLAKQSEYPTDQYQALVDMGQAMMDEASKPHAPGFSFMASLSAGTKAYTNKIRQLKAEYDKDQEALDKAIIQQNHLDYVAQETNNKAAIDARNAKRKEIADLQAKRFEVQGNMQHYLAQLGISAMTARATMARANKPASQTDWQRQYQIAYSAAKQKYPNLPDAQVQKMALDYIAAQKGSENKDWATSLAIRKQAEESVSTRLDPLSGSREAREYTRLQKEDEASGGNTADAYREGLIQDYIKSVTGNSAQPQLGQGIADQGDQEEQEDIDFSSLTSSNQ